MKHRDYGIARLATERVLIEFDCTGAEHGNARCPGQVLLAALTDATVDGPLCSGCWPDGWRCSASVYVPKELSHA